MLRFHPKPQPPANCGHVKSPPPGVRVYHHSLACSDFISCRSEKPRAVFPPSIYVAYWRIVPAHVLMQEPRQRRFLLESVTSLTVEARPCALPSKPPLSSRNHPLWPPPGRHAFLLPQGETVVPRARHRFVGHFPVRHHLYLFISIVVHTLTRPHPKVGFFLFFFYFAFPPDSWYWSLGNPVAHSWPVVRGYRPNRSKSSLIPFFVPFHKCS